MLSLHLETASVAAAAATAATAAETVAVPVTFPVTVVITITIVPHSAPSFPRDVLYAFFLRSNIIFRLDAVGEDRNATPVW
jgi:hypothetical protein